MEITSNTPEDTLALGSDLAPQLRPGDLVLLYGGLGAGKTLLTKGVMAGLGYDVDEVTSPSFALVNLYRTDVFDVYHIDLWRIGPGNGIASIGLDEILESGDSITIVEWAENLGERPFPDRTIRVYLSGDGDDPRTIKVSMPEDSREKI